MHRFARTSAIAIAFLFAFFFTARASQAQWSTVGAMRPAGRSPASLTFRDTRSIVSVTAESPDIIRVRFSPTRDFGRDHSYAVLPLPAAGDTPMISVEKDRSILATRSLRVTIRHAPFRLAIADAAGDVLDEDDPAQGMASSGAMVRAFKRLRVDEHVYGLGEKTGHARQAWTPARRLRVHDVEQRHVRVRPDTDPIYVSVPFAIVMRGGKAHGLFLDNTSSQQLRHRAHLRWHPRVRRRPGRAELLLHQRPHAGRRRVALYVADRPHADAAAVGARLSPVPVQLLPRVHGPIRRAELPHARHIPADTIWLDIHYMDGFKPFTWDPERFPDPARLIADLRAQGLRLVTIVDPHPKKEPGYEPFDTGLAGGHFVKNPDGSIYEAPVWPARADRNPGPSVFPGFHAAGHAHVVGDASTARLLDIGVAGIWNDMNEPAVFDTPTGTMPLDVQFDDEGSPAAHRAVHNVYGQQMSRATYEGLQQLRPDSRPFVLTRATYAGGQRYAAVWAGDNVSEWGHLRGSIPMLMGMGLSGLPFVGVDIGGFAETPSAELYTRWLQLGVFYPFMRTHTTLGTPDQDPWSYGQEHEALNRRAIELRYELLPHIYNVMHEASVSGLPALRPLMLEFPNDPATYGLDDEFMFGRDLLVAPVLWPNATERSVSSARHVGRLLERRAIHRRHEPPRAGHAALDSPLRQGRRVRVRAPRRAAHGRAAGPAVAGDGGARRRRRRRAVRRRRRDARVYARHVGHARVPPPDERRHADHRDRRTGRTLPSRQPRCVAARPTSAACARDGRRRRGPPRHVCRARDARRRRVGRGRVRRRDRAHAR